MRYRRNNPESPSPSAALRRIRPIPEGSRSVLGVVGYVLGWGRAGAGVAQECIELGVELVELPHSLLVRDPALLELDLSQLLVDDGSPIEQLLRRNLRLRQPAAEPGQQRGVIGRLIKTAFAD